MSSATQQQTLYIFSTDLPDGPSETFMLTELEELSRRDLKLVIFPFRKKVKPHSHIDEKIEVNNCMASYEESDKKVTADLFFLFFKVLAIDLKNNPKAALKTLGSLRKVFSLYKSMYFRAVYFKQCAGSLDNTALYYTYWWEDWSLILCLLKLKGELPRGRLVTRAHGYDLYAGRRDGFIPLRGLQLWCTDGIYTISKNGSQYLTTKYPRFSNKIFNFYLGTSDKGYAPAAFDSDEYQLISVSDFREVKRVWLIVEILRHVKLNLKWTHVGAEKDLEECKKNLGLEKLPANIRYDFKGFISSEALYELYRAVPFDLFINVSSSEGLPLSIMEAMSMGVPSVATNVGGTSELITNDTGFLLEEDFNPVAAAEKITAYLTQVRANSGHKQKVRSHWERNFKNSVNSKQFADHLLSK